MAWTISFSHTCNELRLISNGTIAVSGCRPGCFFRREENVVVLLSAKVSSEHTSLIAPLKLPSSSLAETLDARILVGSRLVERREIELRFATALSVDGASLS